MYGSSPPDYVVECAEILNGDTIVVEDSAGTRKTVHVHGIDAPEADQPYGPAATRAARRTVEGRRVEVEVTGEEGSGALVGRVRAGREWLGPRLLRQGLAWHDPRQAPGATSLLAAQREARTNERGLWAHENPVPPWEDRKHDTPSQTAAWGLVQRTLSLVTDRAGRDTPVASTE